MLAMMKRQAAAIAAEGGAEGGGTPRASPPTMSASADLGDLGVNLGNLGPVGRQICARLNDELEPATLELVDQSAQHAGHAGAKGLAGVPRS